MMPLYHNRTEAGKKLAALLKKYKKQQPIILALPRGGVPVGYEIAKKLKSPLDVIIVRKLGSPLNPEFGIGAIAENSVEILNHDALSQFSITAEEVAGVIRKETAELRRRKKAYRGGEALPALKGRTVILVDDGIATGITAEAAILAVVKGSPKEIIFTVPVASVESAEKIEKMVNMFICPQIVSGLESVGGYYEQFDQVSDAEVVSLLTAAKETKLK